MKCPFSLSISMMFISSAISTDIFALSGGHDARARLLPPKKTDPPTLRPSFPPSTSPTGIPTLHPTISPTKFPTITPSLFPSNIHSSIPSSKPSEFISEMPSDFFSSLPSERPASMPSQSPSVMPSQSPSVMPSSSLSSVPTHKVFNTEPPTRKVTFQPTLQPTDSPTRLHTAKPSASPSVSKSFEPTINPTVAFTTSPTITPTSRTTLQPTNDPTLVSTIDPRRLVFLSASINTIIQSVPRQMNANQKDIYKSDVQTFITALFEKTSPPVSNIEVLVGNQILFDENGDTSNSVKNRQLQFVQDGIKLYTLQVEILVSGEYENLPQYQRQGVDMKAYVESFFINHGHVLRDFIKGRHLDYFVEVDKISALPTSQDIDPASLSSPDVFRIVAISIFACLCVLVILLIFFWLRGKNRKAKAASVLNMANTSNNVETRPDFQKIHMLPNDLDSPTSVANLSNDQYARSKLDLDERSAYSIERSSVGPVDRSIDYVDERSTVNRKEVIFAHAIERPTIDYMGDTKIPHISRSDTDEVSSIHSLTPPVIDPILQPSTNYTDRSVGRPISRTGSNGSSSWRDVTDRSFDQYHERTMPQYTDRSFDYQSSGLNRNVERSAHYAAIDRPHHAHNRVYSIPENSSVRSMDSASTFGSTKRAGNAGIDIDAHLTNTYRTDRSYSSLPRTITSSKQYGGHRMQDDDISSVTSLRSTELNSIAETLDSVGTSSKWRKIECSAPPGKLGLVIRSSTLAPFVRSLNENSPLRGKILPGDFIISIDDVDTRSMPADTATKIAESRQDQVRRFTVLTRRRIP